MVKEGAQGLYAVSDLGTRKPRNKEEELLSAIITRLNELFVTDGLTDRDLINYAYTIRDKVSENKRVMHQIANNAPEQALLGDFASGFSVGDFRYAAGGDESRAWCPRVHSLANRVKA